MTTSELQKRLTKGCAYTGITYALISIAYIAVAAYLVYLQIKILSHADYELNIYRLSLVLPIFLLTLYIGFFFYKIYKYLFAYKKQISNDLDGFIEDFSDWSLVTNLILAFLFCRLAILVVLVINAHIIYNIQDIAKDKNKKRRMQKDISEYEKLENNSYEDISTETRFGRDLQKYREEKAKGKVKV